MSEFKVFAVAVEKNIAKLTEEYQLYRTDISRDQLWETYINAFPEGTNPIFKERTEHDCSCCRHFIKDVGNMVMIEDNQLISIWNIADLPEPYKTVARIMDQTVTSAPILNVFKYYQNTAGYKSNRDNINPEIIWDHFYSKIPNKFVEKNSGSTLSDFRSNVHVFQRGLEEFTIDALDTVLELIAQNAIYRGAEFKKMVSDFRKMKIEYDKANNKNIFVWQFADRTKFRNSAIGTLVADIAAETPLDDAVKIFESKVAPENYKRTTALVTPKMIKNAEEKIKEMGFLNSLARRHATMEDITINNVIFADRVAKTEMSVFDKLIQETAKPVNKKKLQKIDEISIDTFISDIVPTAESIEIMFDYNHKNRLFNLIAPVNKEAPSMLKWNNNFSWAYNGDVTDSIKDRVKRAGGNINAVLRCSLSWYNTDDLDIHVVEPDGTIIYHSHLQSYKTSGKLDVDMNASSPYTTNAVENIVWTNKSKMLEGKYQIKIHNYKKRNNDNQGFEVEIEYEGKIYNFHSMTNPTNKKFNNIISFEFSKKDGLKINRNASIQSVWNLTTDNFHTVNALMYSPNYWDGQTGIGNKHYMFIINKCINFDRPRGFFNEFLNNDLMEHRKVFEILGNKMLVQESEKQLAGLGFSSTVPAEILLKVGGAFNRIIKIKI